MFKFKRLKFKKLICLLGNLISFNGPGAIAFNLISILLLLAFLPLNYASNFPLKCIFNTYVLPWVYGGNCPSTGLFAHCECPACGLTRALSQLLHGDWSGAFILNKIAFVVVLVMLILIIINLRKIWLNK